ncbi:hypothetical protein [Acidimangrovimonas pyrenivorans]|uniref:Uncharacterized protein n=1 Tax=Acidimangrovimonas pyrenivorans TaxID=2030798 RepID=A0ABV7AIP5_9RHOB
MDRDLEHEIEQTLRERAQYFSARWFGRLFRAELSLADTFWVGMYGVLLVIVPGMFALSFAVKIFAPAAGVTVFSALALVLALYWAAATRAVILTARRAPEAAGGWRRAAVVFAVLSTLGAFFGGLAGVL